MTLLALLAAAALALAPAEALAPHFRTYSGLIDTKDPTPEAPASLNELEVVLDASGLRARRTTGHLDQPVVGELIPMAELELLEPAEAAKRVPESLPAHELAFARKGRTYPVFLLGHGSLMIRTADALTILDDADRQIERFMRTWGPVLIPEFGPDLIPRLKYGGRLRPAPIKVQP